MLYFDQSTGTYHENLDPFEKQPKPRLTTMYTIRAVYLDGHEALRMPRFRTPEEARQYRERYINDHFDGYYIRDRFYPTTLVFCDVIPVKVRTLFREEFEKELS